MRTCRIKFVNMLMTQNAMLEREMNYLTDYMEASVGLSGVLPRFPETKPIQIGVVHLNNIKVDRSTIGVLNVGMLEMVDSAVTVLKGSGEGDKVAEAILELTQAILASTALQNATKDEILELLSAVAAEGTAPKGKRRLAVARTLLDQLGAILKMATDLAGLWDRVRPILETIFQT